MDTQSLCRICFGTGHFCVNGYEVNVHGNNISMQRMIQRFSDIELVDANIPEMICENCTHDLVQSYLFTEKIQQADEKIFRLYHSQAEEPEQSIIYEAEGQSQKDPQEEKCKGKGVVEELCKEEVIEEEAIEGTATEEDAEDDAFSRSSQIFEGHLTDEDQDTVYINAESEYVEEVYINPECLQSEDDLISVTESLPPKETYTKDSQIVLTDGVSSLLSNVENVDQEMSEPKRKVYCKKRCRRNREINGSGSFVIAQFTPSSASKVQLGITGIPDENDEVTLSDIRTMNFEPVEVKAENMSVITEDNQGELPIHDTRVYLCQYCPKAFSSSPFLMAHVRKSHGCKYCAQMFEKSTDLYKHIREEHTSFKCVVCEKDFISNSNLRYHLKTVHKVKVPANMALLAYKRDLQKENEKSCEY